MPSRSLLINLMRPFWSQVFKYLKNKTLEYGASKISLKNGKPIKRSHFHQNCTSTDLSAWLCFSGRLIRWAKRLLLCGTSVGLTRGTYSMWGYVWIHPLLLKGLKWASNGRRWIGQSIIWNTAAKGLQAWTPGTCYEIHCTDHTPNDSKMMWAIKAEWSLALYRTDGSLFLAWKCAPVCYYTERCAFTGLWELLWHLMFLCVKFSLPTPSQVPFLPLRRPNSLQWFPIMALKTCRFVKGPRSGNPMLWIISSMQSAIHD